MKVYDIATAVRCLGKFRVTDTGGFADPDTITMVLQSPAPASIETVYQFGTSAMVKDSVGQYHLDVGPWTADQAGIWHYRYVGTGAVKVGGGGSFRIAKPEFANPFGTP